MFINHFILFGRCVYKHVHSFHWNVYKHISVDDGKFHLWESQTNKSPNKCLQISGVHNLVLGWCVPQLVKAVGIGWQRQNLKGQSYRTPLYWLVKKWVGFQCVLFRVILSIFLCFILLMIIIIVVVFLLQLEFVNSSWSISSIGRENNSCSWLSAQFWLLY